MRMLGTLGSLDQHRIRTGALDDAGWKQLMDAVERLSKASIFIDDSGMLNGTELCSRARSLNRRCGGPGLGLIVLDDLQVLARELNVPVIALSRLRRTLKKRTNKRPVMFDLRGLGVIEQNPDLVLFIYRDEVYDPDSPDKGKAEVIIGKSRNGPIGTVMLKFVGQYTRFANWLGLRFWRRPREQPTYPRFHLHQPTKGLPTWSHLPQTATPIQVPMCRRAWLGRLAWFRISPSRILSPAGQINWLLPSRSRLPCIRNPPAILSSYMEQLGMARLIS